jgi:hypothetical protein
MPTSSPTSAPEIMKCEESTKKWIISTPNQLSKGLLKLIELDGIHEK